LRWWRWIMLGRWVLHMLIVCVLGGVLLLMLRCECFLWLSGRKLFYCVHPACPFGCVVCCFL